MPGQHQNGCTNNRVALRDFQLFQMGILHKYNEFAKRTVLPGGLRMGLFWGRCAAKISFRGMTDRVLMPAEDYMRFRGVVVRSFLMGFTSPVRRGQSLQFHPMATYWRDESTSLPHEYVDIHAEWGVCLDIFPLSPCPRKALKIGTALTLR